MTDLESITSFRYVTGTQIGLERMKRCPVGMPFYMINRHRINVFPQNELSGACNGRTIKPAFLCDLYRVESRKTAYGRSRVFRKRVEGFQEKGRGFSEKGSRVFGKRVEGFRKKGRGFSEKPSRVFRKRVEGFRRNRRGFSGKGSRVFRKRVEGFRKKGRGFSEKGSRVFGKKTIFAPLSRKGCHVNPLTIVFRTCSFVS